MRVAALAFLVSTAGSDVRHDSRESQIPHTLRESAENTSRDRMGLRVEAQAEIGACSWDSEVNSSRREKQHKAYCAARAHPEA